MTKPEYTLYSDVQKRLCTQPTSTRTCKWKDHTCVRIQ